MAISPKIREDGSGGVESPWATDLDAVAITVDRNGRGSVGTPSVQIDSNERIACATATNNEGAAGWGAAANFADGVIRAIVRTSHAGGSDNDYGTLSARKTASNGDHVSLRLKFGGTEYSIVSYSTGDASTIAASQVAKTFVQDTDYEALFWFSSTSYKHATWDASQFPPGSDYKTITWDWAGTDATPLTSSGKCSVGMARFQTAQPTVYFDNLLAYGSGESVTAATVALTPGDSQVTIDVSEPSTAQMRGALWWFLRYKAASQPTDENDGTIVTGVGSGLTGGAGIRSDGRFIGWQSHDLTGLSNGTTYYVRPFAVMADGTIVAGTSDSTTPGGADSTPPAVPTNFVAAYASPFAAAEIDLTWTNPSESGDYLVNYRTDSTYPTASNDSSATVAVNWTAYTGSTAGSEDLTTLTDGLRYMIGLWHRDAVPNVNAGAFTQLVAVGRVVLYLPADASMGTGVTPYLIWHTAQGEAEDNRPVHYKVEVSTNEASEQDFLDNLVFVISSLDDGPGGFEYESSAGVWTALLVSGLAASDVGKDVRFASGLVVEDQYFWRVSAQQPTT